MRIKVTIEDITVEIDRPNFIDYSRDSDKSDVRTNIMNDTVLPMLREAIVQVTSLYNERLNKDK